MTDLPKWLASGLPSELVAIETNSRVLSVQPAASNRPADRNRDRATRDRQIGDEAPFSIELAPEGQGAERSGHGAAAPAAGADPTTARRLTADRVVLTAPIPQALGLTAVPVRGTLRSALATAGIHESARTPIYAPCLTLLVHLRGAPDELLDDHGVAPRRPEIETPVEWVADNARKGLAPDSETDGDGRGVQTERVARVRSPDTFLTVHFAPEFSRSWYEEPDDAVTTALISALANYLRAVGDGTMDGSDPYETLSRVYRAGGVQLKKWRYARPNVEPAQDVAYVEAPAGLFLAGEAFRAGRVEGAFLSGRAAGRAAARERE
jgi:predicted NAD/FAD-dependent oxidoreductase